MSWIDVIHEDNAEGKLKEVYDEISKSRGKVANILKVHSLRPESLQAHMDLYMSIMYRPSGISREQRELIATVVSSINNCAYCTNHHAEALNFYWKDDERKESLVNDFTQIEYKPEDQAMIDYAVKLTRNPSSVLESGIKTLREHNFSDEAILNINLTTSYFNFVNRVAEGLGVEYSKEEIEGYKF